MSLDLAAYTVGRHSATEVPQDTVDPRGLLWVWEPPSPRHEYIVSVDPTVGIPGWNRQLRTKDDLHTDNAAIEVFRRPGIQVAEFAAPIDVYDLAGICNYVGKMYAGNSEDGQALMGIEVYPGPGWQVQTELVQKYGYQNFPPWLVMGKGMTQMPTGKFGWYSTKSTRVDLWTRCTSLLQRREVVLRSPWLIDEMADCTPDSFYAITGRARNGLHDDRVVSTLLNIWWLNEWSLDPEPTDRDTRESTTPLNYQAMACDESGRAITASSLNEDWDDLASRLLDE
jgi:hypothetical protein